MVPTTCKEAFRANITIVQRACASGDSKTWLRLKRVRLTGGDKLIVFATGNQEAKSDANSRTLQFVTAANS